MKTPRLSLSLSLATLVLALSACNADRGRTADVTPPPAADQPDAEGPAAAPTTPAPAVAPAAPTDGEALALLGAIDEHEIAAAEQARGKDVTIRVRDYANMLHDAHRMNLTATRAAAATARIVLADTPAVASQRARAKSELTALGALEGAAYEKAYVDAMVRGHAEALAMLDERLLPAVVDPTVKQHLTTTRGNIANHLETGKTLQTKL
jgi:putative membrane protein